MTFPSLFHQIKDVMIIPAVSPFLIPGGSPGLADSGGSTANVNHTTFSMMPNLPGLELPSMEMAWTLTSVMRELNPLFAWYHESLSALTIARAVEESNVRMVPIKKGGGEWALTDISDMEVFGLQIVHSVEVTQHKS